jgi:predicted RNA-binding protein with PUA-like domain
MASWLVKTEPATYSFDDLLREGTTAWSGVKNALAQIHLRSMQKGDEVFVYHSGKEKSIVGLGTIVTAAYPDTTDSSGTRVAVTIKPVRRFDSPVTLAGMKRQKEFSAFDLLRITRLSVLPVPPDIRTRILTLTEQR